MLFVNIGKARRKSGLSHFNRPHLSSMRKAILITGAGSGIGRASAVRFASEGFDLILVGRRLAPLEETKGLMVGTGQHVILALDVSDRVMFHKRLAEAMAVESNRELIGVFANAGIGGGNGYAVEEGEDRWGEIMMANVTGVYVTLQTAYPYLKAAQQAVTHAVVTSSVLARFGVPGQSAYVTSKTAVLGLVRSLAIEWGGDGILVNAICPGWVETAMAQESIQRMADGQGISYEDCHGQQCALLPTGRMSQPSEVADFVSWLMSPEQKGFTGQGLDLNNGSWMS
jgi:NAD(P)-dependent dehydrogenase (short-subunit alcohol dehydrogenase family)